MTALFQSLIDAVSAGAVYALAALGIGLVFGVLGLANFAHAEIITAAAYTLVSTWKYGAFVSILLSILASVVVAFVMDFVVFARFRRADPATLLIASFGVSILFQRIYEAIFSANVKTAAIAPALSQSFVVGGLRVKWLSAAAITLAVILLVLLQLFLRKTSLGLQVQAASSDFTTARLLGIPSGRVIAIVFALSGVLAAAVAFVQTTQTGSVTPSFGVPVTLMGLVGAVVGGLGKINGALVGGFVVGFALSLLTSWLPSGTLDFRVAFAYLFVIAILVFKPTGLLSRRRAEVRA